MTPQQITSLRKNLYRTQAQFASILGVHTMTLSRWERGKETPHPRYQQKLEKLWRFAEKQEREAR